MKSSDIDSDALDDKIFDIMVKVSVSTIERKKGKYLKMAHEGIKFLITKRGIPWAILGPTLPEAKIRKSQKSIN